MQSVAKRGLPGFPAGSGAWTGQFVIRKCISGSSRAGPWPARGLDCSVCIKKCTSGSSRAGSWPARGLDCSVCINNCISGCSRAGSWPARGSARRQILVRRATGAPLDVVIRGRPGALSPLRGATFFFGSFRNGAFFEKWASRSGFGLLTLHIVIQNSNQNFALAAARCFFLCIGCVLGLTELRSRCCAVPVLWVRSVCNGWLALAGRNFLEFH